jgi:hypothetical protein
MGKENKGFYLMCVMINKKMLHNFLVSFGTSIVGGVVVGYAILNVPTLAMYWSIIILGLVLVVAGMWMNPQE